MSEAPGLPPPPSAVVPAGRNTKALISFICALAGIWFAPLIGSIAAVTPGQEATKAIKASGGVQTGRRLLLLDPAGETSQGLDP